ncbi:large polymerase protein [avian paramyxovirus 7]|uniref:RNA-directed RNA polymerase L n=1 Tax=avian paramyxovirus 7 TaxID=2560317 RepID=C6FGZ1_9MONO|nr:large polymerase protein [Avian metaavulavirus 7]ACN72645.1 large polymerase protein [Avian metaavulavirus 7]
MEFRQSDQIIHPEVHLDSPIIGNKILYLWRITGLPTPPVLELNSTISPEVWTNLKANDPRVAFKWDKLRPRLLTWAAHQGISLSDLIPITHPESLQWLTTISCPKIDENFALIKKCLLRTRDYTASGFKNLFQMISQKLTSTNILFCAENPTTPPISDEASWALKNPEHWFNTPWSSCCMFWLHVKQTMRNLIRIQRSQPESQSIYSITVDNLFVGLTPDLCVIADSQRQSITVLSFECVLMYCDLIEGRNNVYDLCQLSPVLSPLQDRILLLLRLIDSLAYDIGAPIFDVIASLESLAYGAIQLYDYDTEAAGDFFSFNLREISQVIEESKCRNQTHTIISAISKIYTGINPDQAAEMLCIMRLWGHPLLYASKAASKVRESMCAPKVIQFDAMLLVLAFFKRSIINGYRRKHGGLWPNIIVESLLSAELVAAHHDAVELTDTFVIKHYREVAMIDFKKSFDYDIGDDLSLYLKDKAICRQKSEWLNIFKGQLLEPAVRSKRIRGIGENRLLLHFLNSVDFDPEQEFKYVTDMEYLYDETFCASYSLKEKEVKRDGRIFAKMTPKMRSCQVLLEALLAKHVSELFKENGVSMEQISLTKSLVAMSQLAPRVNMRGGRAARSTDVKINQRRVKSIKEHVKSRNDSNQEKIVIAGYLTTDLQKYCLNWRYESIKLFARALNQLFGIPHGFEWIHLRLIRSTMFVGDPYNPPASIQSLDLDEQPNDDIFIVSPRGGIEGLCQKMWTLISIALIQAAAAKIGCRVTSMVQGDNQVIAITREVRVGEPVREASRELRLLCDEFFTEFKQLNYGIGHNLKAKETIKSQSFFVYSKRVFFEGRVLSQILKNASKLNLISDCLAENTVASCSNISSTVARLIENGLGKDVAFILNFQTIIRQLIFDEVYTISLNYSTARRQVGSENPHALAIAALIPGQLGGFNFLNVARLFTRNIGDPITCSLSDIKWFAKVGLMPEYILKNIVLRAPGSGTWTTLVADPYSLNITYTKLPTSYLKKHTQRTLVADSPNPLLQGVFLLNQQQEDEALCKFLLDREQVMPRAAHVIYDQSVLGRRKYLQGLVDTTQTIIRYALQKMPVSYKKSEKIQNYNLLYIQSLFDEVLTQNVIHSGLDTIWKRDLISIETCSVTLANFTRTCSWSNILQGRQIVGVTTPDTIELCTGSLISCNSACEFCRIGDKSYSWFHTPGGISFDTMSPGNLIQRVPYLGSKTDEQRAASLTTIKGMDYHLRQALRGASLYVWAYGETDQNWLDALKLANTRCNVTLQALTALCPIPSTANLQHRLADGISTVKFTPASLSRIAAYIHICNDQQKHDNLGNSFESNLIYQQIMLLGTGIFETIFPLSVQYIHEEQTLHLHTGFSCCVREADTMIIDESRTGFPGLTVTKSNKFLFNPDPIPAVWADKIFTTEFRFFEYNIENQGTYELIKFLSSCCAKVVTESLVQDTFHSSVKNDAIIAYDNSINYISELQQCDIVLFSSELGKELLLDLAYQLYYLRIRSKRGIISYLKVLLTRLPIIQFAPLALTISHPVIYERLRQRRLVMEPLQPYLASIDYVKAARELVLIGASSYLSMLETGLDTTYNIYSHLDGDSEGKIDQAMARRLCLITLLVNPGYALPVIKGLTAIEKCRLLTDFLQSDIISVSLSEQIATLILTPKIEVHPTNLYYMMRKTLNLIRSRDDTVVIMAELYNIDQESAIMRVESEEDGPVDKMNLAPILRLVPITFKSMDLHALTGLGRKEVELMGSPVCKITQRLDKYIYRTIGTISTAWYKASSLIASDILKGGPLGDSLYLCEGSGSSMTCLEYCFPSKTIWYNSFFSNELNPPQRNIGPLPTQFCSSIVYHNLNAEVPCSAGFIQDFKVLWADKSVETDISTTECVNFILSKVELETCKLIHADLDLPIETPRSVWMACVTNTFILGNALLKSGGKLVMKLYAVDELLFSSCLGFAWCLMDDINILRNGYFNDKSKECYLIGTKKVTIPHQKIQDIQQQINKIASQGLSVIPEAVIHDIYNQLEDSIRCEKKFKNDNAPTWSNGILNSTDLLLIRLGGKPIGESLLELTSIQGMDYDDLTGDIIQVIDTALNEIIHLKSDTSSLDLVLLMSPYNLALGGKISTILKSVVHQTLILRIIQSRQNKDIPLKGWLSLLNQGVISLSSLIPLHDYLRKSKLRKFIVQKLGQQELQAFWQSRSQQMLSRSETKLLIKVLSAAWKGLL